MSQTSIPFEPTNAPVEAPSDSARGSIIAGLVILAVFFGAFGTWAATAPLNSAIVGEAVVKVEGNRKSVQHLDGGIVRELRVAEGARVAQGDVLVVLDDTETRAEYDILTRQDAILRAAEARLLAELAGATEITFPPELMARLDDPVVRIAVAAQQNEFRSRQATLAGDVQILEQRRSQLREQADGSVAQSRAYTEQLASVREERASLEPLYNDGLIAKPRLLQLERTATGLEGQIAATDASIAAAERSIAEVSRQIDQVHQTRAAEVAAKLAEVQSQMLDVTPRLHAVAARLDRMEIRAPYAGEVVDLAVHAVGAVIGRGERILDIVPDSSALVVEARIAVNDIADLHPGMEAEVHLTSYKQRLIPVIHGTVTQVSADRLTDERLGHAYYVAEVTVDPQELAASPQIQLYPGMPATVMVTTRERSALDYLVGPFVASFDRSFRQQ